MTGTVTLSVEIELAWGLAHEGEVTPTKRHGPERVDETVRLEALTALCDELDLPVSFDVVGHLLLNSCDGDHGGSHPVGWFDADPGTDRETDPLYYAPDLVERVVSSETDHELCTHTFSHTRCDQVDDAVVDWELSRVTELHADRGYAPVESFVPPVHAPPPLDVLRDHGIRTVRKPVEYRPPVEEPEPPQEIPQRLAWHFGHSHPVETLFRTPVTCAPRRREDLVETYTSWHASLSAPYLRNGRMYPHPLYRAIPRSIRQRNHLHYLRAGLRAAAEEGESIHYWTHLFNLTAPEQWAPVQQFLKELAWHREDGSVRVQTMAELGRTTA